MKRGKPGPDERAAAEGARKLRYQKRETSMPIVQAMANLDVELVKCALQYHEGGELNEREAVHSSLTLLRDTLVGLGFSMATLEPLHRVIVALVETERGRIDPIFRPIRRQAGGAPPLSLDRMTGDGTLAGLAQLWVDANKGDGRTQKVLLKEAAVHIKGKWCPSVSGP